MYKIGDFSRVADIPIKILRYYDDGYRYYEDLSVKDISNQI